MQVPETNILKLHNGVQNIFSEMHINESLDKETYFLNENRLSLKCGNLYLLPKPTEVVNRFTTL